MGLSLSLANSVTRMGESEILVDASVRYCPACRFAYAGYFFLLLALVVIVNLIEEAAALRLERAVVDARRPAGIGGRVERFAAFALLIVADDEIAGDQIDLLPMVVHERRGGEDTGLDAQETGAAAHFARLVEVACQNFLLDPRGIAGRRGPATVHVHAGKLEMRLVHRHRSSPAIILDSSPGWVCSQAATDERARSR